MPSRSLSDRLRRVPYVPPGAPPPVVVWRGGGPRRLGLGVLVLLGCLVVVAVVNTALGRPELLADGGAVVICGLTAWGLAAPHMDDFVVVAVGPGYLTRATALVTQQVDTRRVGGCALWPASQLGPAHWLIAGGYRWGKLKLHLHLREEAPELWEEAIAELRRGAVEGETRFSAVREVVGSAVPLRPDGWRPAA